MNERGRNVAVGLTTVLALVALMMLLLLFGYVPRFLQEGYTVEVRLRDAAALHVGSRVELSGIDIGSVRGIGFMKPFGSGIRVKLLIDRDVAIPTSAQAVVEKPLLGGSSNIKFVMGDAQAPFDFLPRDGSAVVEGQPGALAGAFGELERMTDSFDALSAQWQQVGRNVNRMLEPRDLDAVEAGDAQGNLTTLITRIDRRLSEFQEILAGVEAIVNDPELHRNISRTGRNVRQVSANMITALDQMKVRYMAVADDLAGVVAKLDTFVQAANSTEGSVGKLVNDPALYDNVNDAALRIGQAVDELTLLIHKWKAEGVPVSF